LRSHERIYCLNEFEVHERAFGNHHYAKNCTITITKSHQEYFITKTWSNRLCNYCTIKYSKYFFPIVSNIVLQFDYETFKQDYCISNYFFQLTNYFLLN
jgi:hypothetical protein